MGGRGSKSGLIPRGRNASLTSLLQQIEDNKNLKGANWMYQGDYTDDNNKALVRYQTEADDDIARFLAGTDQKIDLTDKAYADKYPYYDIPLNKLLLRLGVGKGATVLNDAEFDAYIQQSGQQVVYRGWSGEAAVERFCNTVHNHVGNGRYGDGYYFSPDVSVAQDYARMSRTGQGVVTRMALSPNARVIDYNTLKNMIAQVSPKLQGALYHTGHGGSGRTYGANIGEAQFALKLGYNVIDTGTGYVYGITNDAFVINRN